MSIQSIKYDQFELFFGTIVFTSLPLTGTRLQYTGEGGSNKSSLTILGHSLKSNQTYQFVVNVINRQNPSLQGQGFVLVEMRDTQPQLIVIG